nr:putative lipoprotein [uncultured bacterium]
MVFIGVAMVHESAHTRAQSTHTHAQTGVAAASAVQMETLLQSDTSWDGVFYQGYLEGRPELTVVKLTVPPHTALPWHNHPMPNAAYVVSGQIQVQRQVDGLTLNMGAGQVLAEMVDTPHRGVTGDEPAVLIVFYAGSPGLPLSDIVQ